MRTASWNVRVGVIGAGIMGTDHAHILQRDVPGCDVAVIADVDAGRAAALAASIDGAALMDDPLDLIGSPDVDAVLVASSDDSHAEFVRACLAAGKPVLCEKPLAPSAAECQALVREEQVVVGDGVPLVSLGFMRRFDPGYVDLKALVISGTLGTPLVVHSVGRGVGAPAGTNELTVTGSAIHDIDIVPWLLDDAVTEVSWLAPRQSPEVADRQDPQLILMRTSEGALVTVEVFLHARYGYDIRCEVVGSRSTASLAEPHVVVRDHDLAHGRGYAADWRPRFGEAYRLQNRAWIEALRTGIRPPLANAGDGLRAALVADAVIASMRSGGAWIAVAEQGG